MSIKKHYKRNLFFYFFAIFSFININNIHAEDYYWVAGSGSWSELNHWATSSGGSVFHSSVPAFDDNVIFDANSFSETDNSVLLNVENAICANLDFSALANSLDLSGNNELHIYETLIMSPLVNFAFNGNLYFEAEDKDYTVFTEDKNFSCNVIFSGLSCNWIIDGSFNCDKTLSLTTPNSTFEFADINLAGSLEISSYSSTITVTATINVNRNFWLTGTATKLQTHGDVNVGNDLLCLIANGIFLLGGNLRITDRFIINEGTFISNGHNITCSTYALNHNSEVNISNSDLYIENDFVISSQDVMLNSSNSSVYFSGNYSLFKSELPVVFDIINFSSDGIFDCSNSTIQNLTFGGTGTIKGNQNQFAAALLNKNGQFIGNHQYNILSLTAGYQYVFQSNTTQTITNGLNASGNCSNFVVLKSDTQNTQAHISKSTGTVNLDYFIVQDMDFTGGAIFLASNYTNIQNTTGLSGSAIAGRSLYWVGGAGNWNDPIHWSDQSGGAGGQCIPSPVDDVVFDGNSFTTAQQQVLLATEQGFCKTMDWIQVTNNPVFANYLPNARMNIFGSIILNSVMDNSFSGDIIFSSTNLGNEIQSNGNSFVGNIYFEGEAGEWTLTDELNVQESSIYLNKGTFISGGNTISCENFNANEITYDRLLNIEGSELYLLGNWNVDSEKFGLSAANSHIFFQTKNASMEAGENLTYNNISFLAVNSFSAKLSGNQLNINQLNFLSNGQLDNTNSNIQNLVFEGDGIINGANNLFENAEFKSNGLFADNNAFGTLFLSPAGTYTFTNGKTQTINIDLDAHGNCNAPIHLRSDIENQNAFIEKLNTDLTIDYIIMQDIEAVSTVNYTANNTVDLGNNTGWTINTLTSKNYYWVGNSGNWDDTNHWALLSGGAGGAGGACLPNQNDNVYFDDVSFSVDAQIVTINSEVANCRTMDWSGIDDLVEIKNAGNSDLYIFGSLILSQDLSWNYQGQILFKGVQDDFTVNTEEKVFLDDVFFDGNNATWQFLSNFSTIKSIDLIQGEIIANDITMDASHFLSQTNYVSSLQANNSLLSISNSWNTVFNFSYAGLNTKLVMSENNAAFTYKSSHDVIFHEIDLQGTNIIFSANNATVLKLTVNMGSIDGTNTTIDSLTFENKAEIKGELEVQFGELKSSTTIYNNHNFGKLNFYGLTQIYMDNVFETANFYHDAIINSNNEYDSLKFSPDHTYTLGIYRTQLINNYLSLKGNNCYKIDIRTNTEGVSSNISKPNGIVEGYALNLRGIKTLGNAKFYAAGPSSDLGDNVGWVYGNPPGYIYGFNADSIYLDGEEALISTEHFNTDANTQFIWANGSTQPNYETYEPGKFTVEVVYNSDPDQCSFTDETNIYFAKVKNPTCRSYTDGQISIKSGSNESYSYLWDNGSTNPVLSNLGPGEFTLEITDNNSGKKAHRKFNLVEPDTLKSEFSEIKQISCTGLSDGALSINVSGGNQPYKLVWQDDKNLSSLSRSELAAGTYEVQVTGSANCETVTISSKIIDPGKMLMNIVKIQGISCIGKNDAKLSYAGTGGTKPYSCEWDTGITNDTVYDLSIGQHSVIVTDANNCELLYDTINIQEATSLNYTFNIKDQVCPDSKSGKISVFMTGGTEPYYFEWEHSDINSSDISGLLPGTYKVNITDTFKCETISKTFEIQKGKKIVLENIKMYEPLCYQENSGAIRFDQSGGYGNLLASIDGGVYQPDTYFDNLLAGDHLLIIKDDSLCEQEFDLKLNQPDFLEANYYITNPSCSKSSDGIIEFELIGGTAPYSYNWIDSAGNAFTEMDQLKAGDYILQLTDDNFCSFIDTISLYAAECEPFIKVPNVFSPDNDGINDVFSIEMYNIANFRLDIYSRWGTRLYTMDNDTNYWDGTINNSNRKAVPGAYFYTIVATTIDGEIISKKGSVQLFR